MCSWRCCERHLLLFFGYHQSHLQWKEAADVYDVPGCSGRLRYSWRHLRYPRDRGVFFIITLVLGSQQGVPGATYAGASEEVIEQSVLHFPRLVIRLQRLESRPGYGT
ncbi:rh34 [macacine betaherpesvirus 3]|uniref:Rh34 n=1 Tax=Rhesus cytomegalovirus (strain 68-1) TaxID=47929 RepID=Q7TFU7_RHCM6|nr:rh34 [macacine betaherpesvirus 3]AAP50561.1 rh34 [macacine betaherpesvirus 3]